ncbi:hypothetical protein [Streptomyces sp. V4I23]|uniref:hypothetical protein n=1 Tax=Streptomyces sp. V4I23 TaxID=3042282 RepID=UPI0027D92439|nr:hypothetical protein [Streptomyces sp. V4I23]
MRLRLPVAVAVFVVVLASVFSSPGALAAAGSTMVLQLGNPVLSAQSGQSLTVRMRFEAEPMSEDYAVFVHLVDGSGNIAANGGDHAPPQPTSTWRGTVGYDHTFSLPASIQPGQYSIRVGLFQTHSPWDRVELTTGDGVTSDDQLRYTVATLTVTKAQPATRDPLKWPFAKDSIWNMPIGSEAVYVPANLPQNPGGDEWAPMPLVDDERIVLRPTAPLTKIWFSDAGWSGKNRCGATGDLLLQVPVPSDYVVPHHNDNSSAAFLAPDGRTLLQTQPFTRCWAGKDATSMAVSDPVDIYGDGIRGAHGGSGLSAIGGTLRVGELRPGGQAPRHALKIDVYARQALYKCAHYDDCYRWPATAADSYAVGFYGTEGTNANHAMKMGALLAIPASADLSQLGLETAPAKQLAWTLQNYGAYIVDDTYTPGFAINAEHGPDGSMRDQFKADWGFDLAQRVNDNTPWSRDMQRLAGALHVVENNGPNSIGGGGTPRQPLAPEFQ